VKLEWVPALEPLPVLVELDNWLAFLAWQHDMRELVHPQLNLSHWLSIFPIKEKLTDPPLISAPEDLFDLECGRRYIRQFYGVEFRDGAPVDIFFVAEGAARKALPYEIGRCSIPRP
jgi:hypothetical protein